MESTEHDKCGTPECCGQCDTATTDWKLPPVTRSTENSGNIEIKNNTHIKKAP